MSHISFLSAFLLIAGLASSGAAQTTAFTYQGKLTDSGNPANGDYDMQFKLFDTPTVGTGTQHGVTITNPMVAVTNGIFTVQLNFEAPGVFDGTAERYLEIGVRPSGSPNPYTLLSPRQQFSSSPYAIQTINALQLGGFPPSRFVQFDVFGNVGIGTNSPDRNLTLQSSNGTYLNVKGENGAHEVLLGADASGGILSTMTNHDLQLRAGVNSTKMIIKADGNVGIGTPNPSYKLHVRGTGGNFCVVGDSTDGVGVAGISSTTDGVFGQSNSGPGVFGRSSVNDGVRAFSASGDLINGLNGSGTKFRVENNGTVHAPGYEGSPDFAEAILPTTDDKSHLGPGDVLVAASNTDRSVSKSRKPYSTSVLGVYSTAPGFVGTEHPIEGASSDTIPMAVIGIVPCKVSAENGAIRRGDLLTTSRTPGHAMRCANRSKCIGAIVGKALARLDKGTGLILVLVTLQ